MEDEVLLSDLLGLERGWLRFSNGSSCLTLSLGGKNRSRARESKRKYYSVSQQRPVHCGDVCLSSAELHQGHGALGWKTHFAEELGKYLVQVWAS